MKAFIKCIAKQIIFITMKTETSRIQQLIKNSWEGPMWHGSFLKDVLKDIDAEKAFRKPAAGSHNIYELVMHLCCWRNFVYQHLAGHADYTVEINSTIDWPTQYDANEASWNEALRLLEKSQNELVEALANFDDTQLDRSMHGRKFRWYDLLHGVVEHDIYHSAQIAILKK
jgi:uncharacterized damage-inducible protein DinB